MSQITTKQIKADIKTALLEILGLSVSQSELQREINAVYHNYMVTSCGHEIDLEDAIATTYDDNDYAIGY